ncbi:hypothetical protein C0Q70_11094 [Pomacea canaliculata]|uniref:Uncharacterized protein n=1 Tax=Pomacea canaliculata TaxID=400727 RepID=A0A2T7P530_POMCA|nr:hypothetical protein C0Q70_11094 [Pomacea canaliculata]
MSRTHKLCICEYRGAAGCTEVRGARGPVDRCGARRPACGTAVGWPPRTAWATLQAYSRTYVRSPVENVVRKMTVAAEKVLMALGCSVEIECNWKEPDDIPIEKIAANHAGNCLANNSGLVDELIGTLPVHNGVNGRALSVDGSIPRIF